MADESDRSDWQRPVRPDRPDWGAVQGMFADLTKQLSRTKDIQKQVLHLTGTAWSEDRMIKVVVGPRGQMVELEIDPRVYRRPNSKALSAAILETSRRAVADVAAQAQKIMDEGVPADLRMARSGSLDMRAAMNSHDAELPGMLDEEED